MFSGGEFTFWKDCVSCLCLGLRTRQTLCFQPIVKVVDPVIARFTLFAHTPAMTAGAIDVEFRLVSGRFERLVEGDDLGSGECVVLRHLHKEGWQSFWYWGHVRKRRAVDRSSVIRTRAYLRLDRRKLGDHPAG